MKLAVFSLKNNQSYKREVESQLKKSAFTLTAKNPDVVLSVGGDGTFFFAERTYPGIPKILIKRSNVCIKCQPMSIKTMLQRLAQKRYFIEELPKLETHVGKQKLLAVNDIVIRNKNIQEALRFILKVNTKPLHHEIIGDGAVIATPYGSTAYFHSITGKSFNTGIGIAFNNSTARLAPHIIKGNPRIDIKIIREQAVLAADNNPRTMTIKAGQTITIARSREKAHLISFS